MTEEDLTDEKLREVIDRVLLFNNVGSAMVEGALAERCGDITSEDFNQAKKELLEIMDHMGDPMDKLKALVAEKKPLLNKLIPPGKTQQVTPEQRAKIL
jgi:hypothetical protein